MKRILFLTFYFEPDLCAGSFRNSPLAKELALQGKGDVEIDVITTLPNRYNTFSVDALEKETRDNLTIQRIKIPSHQSGMKDQIISFRKFYSETRRLVKNRKYDIVFASSSRLFTAYLGKKIAKSLGIPLYLDIRDIFYDTLEDVLENRVVKSISLPVVKRIEKETFDYASHINLISGGFKRYFSQYKEKNYSFFPNGIDDIFIEASRGVEIQSENVTCRTIVYAGNLGEGQGLHKIVPQVAKAMEGSVNFIIIGDGGAKGKLLKELTRLEVKNVEVRQPVKRDELLRIYSQADYLFVHLNDYNAFKKVLPSKLFELGCFPQPIIAGVGGFAADFVGNNLENSILFHPCNVDELVEKLSQYEYKRLIRSSFVERFKRDIVNREMAKTILNYI
ncbi:glycosyltransferase family 4 protein [Sphingobacterium sp. JB170]|uniref:glycosyltransferase family 4 protein n=1 Tax=Sphingobacterium sp. JB170 TaxID=1434842 RepID=UPI00097ECDA6|nr:glycosyltransferase family 4 protein [Sphingobacterium sp. JB170]SJN28793.1 Glycosyl transferase, group 1 family protein [Sphingobacterium sp. JB170]